MEYRTRQQQWHDIYGNTLDKAAELAGTYDMPNTKPAPKPKPGEKVAGEGEKTAEATDFLKLAFDQFRGPVETNEHAALPAAAPPAFPQVHLKPHVDVRGKEPKAHATEKKAERYALPLDERYPLDGYDQVKEASAYFDEYANAMPYEVRREYCQNLVPRAEELGIKVSAEAKKYASSKYTPAEEIDLYLEMRKQALQDETHVAVLEKVAATRRYMFPDQFVTLLQQFDKMAGLQDLYGNAFPDPVLSTMGKVAAADPNKALLEGNEYASLQDLVTFAQSRQSVVAQRFGKELAQEFTKDPEGIYKSLPRDQRLIILRMVNNNNSSREGASAP